MSITTKFFIHYFRKIAKTNWICWRKENWSLCCASFEFCSAQNVFCYWYALSWNYSNFPKKDTTSETPDGISFVYCFTQTHMRQTNRISVLVCTLLPICQYICVRFTCVLHLHALLCIDSTIQSFSIDMCVLLFVQWTLAHFDKQFPWASFLLLIPMVTYISAVVSVDFLLQGQKLHTTA